MSSKSAKTFLFVDGSNLYGSQYELFGPHKFLQFSKFIDSIQLVKNIKFSQIFFYASYSPIPSHPTKAQKQYLKNEQYFFRSVRETSHLAFFRGYRSRTSGKEKEVDVKLAVDMIDFAHRKKFDQLYLISGDADFIRALEAVDKLNIPINVLCMPNNIMYRALIHYSTNVITFDQQKLTLDKKKIINQPTWIQLNTNQIIKSIT